MLTSGKLRLDEMILCSYIKLYEGLFSSFSEKLGIPALLSGSCVIPVVSMFLWFARFRDDEIQASIYMRLHTIRMQTKIVKVCLLRTLYLYFRNKNFNPSLAGIG